jgi:hypothetical protein
MEDGCKVQQCVGVFVQVVRWLSQAAALHLLDGSGNFIAMEAVVLRDQRVNGTFYAEGTVLFATPGFSGTNGLPTITCTNTSPLSGITERHWIHRSELVHASASSVRLRG